MLLIAFFSGYMNFAYNFVRCGRAPVIAKYTPFLSGGNPYRNYVEPGSPVYSVSFSNRYYCNAREASDDGLFAE